MAVKQLVSDSAAGIFVRQFESFGTEPLHVNNRDEGVGQDASDGCVRREIFEFHQMLAAVNTRFRKLFRRSLYFVSANREVETRRAEKTNNQSCYWKHEDPCPRLMLRKTTVLVIRRRRIHDTATIKFDAYYRDGRCLTREFFGHLRLLPSFSVSERIVSLDSHPSRELA